jgi:hypothetical protein
MRIEDGINSAAINELYGNIFQKGAINEPRVSMDCRVASATDSSVNTSAFESAHALCFIVLRLPTSPFRAEPKSPFRIT